MSFEKQELIGICIIFYLVIFTYAVILPIVNINLIYIISLLRVLILVGLLISQLAIHVFIRKVVMSNSLVINITYLIVGLLLLELYFSLLLITLLPLLYKLCNADIDGDFLRKINQIELQEIEL